VSALAPTLEAYFTQRLIGQRRASPHTVAAYRDAWRLLLGFAVARAGKQPSHLDIADLDAPLIADFLTHLEQERGNSARTRNARLSAIRSFYQYAALRHPEHAALIARILDIPAKRCQRTEIRHLDQPEIDALLAAPDRRTWTGRRDHALIEVAVQTGLRVSELTSLRLSDLHLGTGPHVRCEGKGRKERCTPLSRHTIKMLREWLEERGGSPGDPLFPTRSGRPLSRSAVSRVVARHAAAAGASCPSLNGKRPTPHVLRHSCAMSLLRSGCDLTVIALWLGHEQVGTTMRAYLHGDLSIKQRALDRTRPPNVKPGRYQPPDQLLAFLNSL
jgi:site-specific recombinase XerD